MVRIVGDQDRWWLRAAFVALTATCVAGKISAQTAAALPLRPAGIAYDAAGNLYFVDTNRNQVFEASLAGALTVVAGSGAQGFGGDGGIAASAMLNAPQGVAIGADGTMYIADAGNQRIRSIAGGVISTFAGNGSAGFAGDGGPALIASFRGPTAIAVDASGAVLVCDSGNERVRRISGGVVSTIVGNGVQGFAGDGGAATAAELDTPSGVAIGSDGRVYIADTHNQRIRVIAADGTISTFAGTGRMGFAGDGAAATAAELALPRGLVCAPDGSLLVADTNNQRIRRIDATGVISSVAGAGPEGNATDGSLAVGSALDSPRAVGISSFGAAVFADTSNRLLRVLAGNGDLYFPAALTSGRTASVTLAMGSSAVYGQVSVSVSVIGTATPQGLVELMDSGTLVRQGSLGAGSVAFLVPSLGAGIHSLSASYAGDGVNPAAVSAVSALSVMQAPSVATMENVSQFSYAGLPLGLTAQVASTTSGTPTGSVSFLDGATLVATGSLLKGVATGTYLAPVAGTHSIQASYGGDANFVASVSPAVNVAVSPVPDFVVSSSGATSQTVVGGSTAGYALIVTGEPGSFSGAVAMSVTGLPVGATASFSPPQVIPGAGTSNVTLTVQTAVKTAFSDRRQEWIWALLLPLLLWRRRRSLAGLAALMVGLAGCGTRTVANVSGPSSEYNLTVTGTSTNLTGAVVVHSTGLTLVVE